MYLRFTDEVVVVLKLDADDFSGDRERGQNIKSTTRMLRRRTEQDRDDRFFIYIHNDLISFSHRVYYSRRYVYFPLRNNRCRLTLICKGKDK